MSSNLIEEHEIIYEIARGTDKSKSWGHKPRSWSRPPSKREIIALPSKRTTPLRIFPTWARIRAYDPSFFGLGQEIERSSVLGQVSIGLKLIEECYDDQPLDEPVSWSISTCSYPSKRFLN